MSSGTRKPVGSERKIKKKVIFEHEKSFMMNRANGWMGGWMDGMMWIWPAIGLAVLILLVVVIYQMLSKKK